MQGFFADEREAQDTVETLNVDLGERSYPIFIGPGLLKETDRLRPHLGQGQAVIISNDTVAPLYLDQVKQTLGDSYGWEIILPDGETHKTLGTISQIYDRLMRAKADRQTTLVALGGGVIGDITGFAAATYQRGINFIQIPTTLLAQVDSSVGGKTGVNHPLGKNMVGAFYQPRCVLIDTEVLLTLPEREIKAGLAEVIKYGLINQPDFLSWLTNNAADILALDAAKLTETIRICCQAKADIVAADEREAGMRALLNLGHTFGHAIETASGYGNLLHGETIAMGMVMAADLSRRLDLLSAEQAAKVRDILENDFSMPVIPPAQISAEDYLELMSSDKKAEQGKIRFILLEALGSAVLTGEVPPDLLKETLTAGDGLCR